MKRQGFHRFVPGVALPLLATIAVCCNTDEIAAANPAQPAADIITFSGAPGGICSVVGANDAELALGLAKRGSFVVQCLVERPADRDRLRKEIRVAGEYGTVSAELLLEKRLPYTDNLVNIIVVSDLPTFRGKGVSLKEIVRALAPLGTAWLGGPSASKADDWVKAVAGELRAVGIAKLEVIESDGTWIRFRKPWPSEIDEWTHYLHDADGNPVAQDRVVGPPKHYQWLSEPLWQRSHETDSSISTLVTAKGRLFAIVDEAPISLAGRHALPDKWMLTARDAFNGVLLWKVPIRRWGWREWKPSWFNTRPGDVPLNIQKRLVAVDDEVFGTLGYYAPVSRLDARTGEVLQTYEETFPTAEVLYLDGKLILSVFTGPRDGAPPASEIAQGKAVLGGGYSAYSKLKVMAVDVESGKTLWESKKSYSGSTVDYIRWRAMHGATRPATLDPSLNMATDGDAVAFIDGSEVVCIDAETGEERWRSKFPLDEADLRAGGVKTEGNLWIGSMIVTAGVVLHASPHRLAAFSAKSGELLWQQPKRYIGHLWYEWKDVFVIDGLVWTWDSELERTQLTRGANKNRKQWSLYPRKVNGYDVKTGKLKRSVDLGFIFKTHHHHRCYRNKATLRYILASRRGTEFVDLEEGRHTVHNWVRGTCHVGMMPANGLQYAPPHPCQCYINEKLNGMTALAPAGAKVEKERTAARLEKGPAYGEVNRNVQPVDPSRDWPTFRHDSMRTGAIEMKVPDEATLRWHAEIGRKLSAPTVVGERVFVALVDEHTVACLDANNGVKHWEFTAGSRVDSPPTYYNGTVLFGSADGWVYCLRADDGTLAWRYHAAPNSRLIGAFGQLESAWPVHGSVLAQDGKVYFAAGRSSQLDGGIHLYALDVTSGELLHERTLAGPDYAVGSEGKLVATPEGSTPNEKTNLFPENYLLPMGTLSDILFADGKRIFMRTDAFDAELKRVNGTPELTVPGGMLDGSFFKRIPWRMANDYARMLVHDRRSVYYVRMFDSLEGLNPEVYFTPGAKGYLLFAKNAEGRGKSWAGRIRVRIRAMVLAGNRLFVAGPPDVMERDDPLGAFEGRKGGLLYVIDSIKGEKIAEHRLPSPPVFNGAAAARGKLVLTLEDGSVVCF